MDNSNALEISKAALKSQYHAALDTLKEALDRCPDELWLDTSHINAFWQTAYHTLFYAHLYLQPDLKSFKPWHGHQGKVQYQDGFAGPPKEGSDLPLIPKPYSKAQVLEFWELCNEMVDGALDSFDLLSNESGFYWYTCGKLEFQIISIRHIQHHTAQLGERLRGAGGTGLTWLGR